MGDKKNIAGLAGVIAAGEVQHHPVFGRQGVSMVELDTERDSGTKDRIILLFQDNAVDRETFGPEGLAAGSRAMVIGKVQTYKDYNTGHVVVFVWCEDLRKAEEGVPQQNGINLVGEVQSPPVYRKTQLGREITEIMLKVPSIFTEGFYSLVPVITWGKNAREAAGYQVGDTVELVGRLQSREYTKNRGKENEETRTVHEISAAKIERKGD